jgi:hypothetical protein
MGKQNCNGCSSAPAVPIGTKQQSQKSLLPTSCPYRDKTAPVQRCHFALPTSCPYRDRKVRIHRYQFIVYMRSTSPFEFCTSHFFPSPGLKAGAIESPCGATNLINFNHQDRMCLVYCIIAIQFSYLTGCSFHTSHFFPSPA